MKVMLALVVELMLLAVLSTNSNISQVIHE